MLKERKNLLLKPDERWDDLMRCGYQIIQNPKYFCFGMDAVLLSGFAKVQENEKVLDLGSGNGIIPILLSAKTKAKQIVGLEIQAPLVDMAVRSVHFNNLEEKVKIVEGDIKEASEYFTKGEFNVITSNPPYMIDKHGQINDNKAISIARHEVLCTFDDIIKTVSSLLNDKGRFYLVHRPFRLAEILYKMQEVGIEPKRLRLVYPFVDKEPNMVLIEGIKGAKPRISIEKPLIVYEKKGKYTQEILDIYGF